MLIRKDNELTVLFGDDLPDVERFLQTEPRQWRQRSSLDFRGGKDWDLGVGWHGALKLAKTGWSEGARNVAFEAAAVTQIGDRPHQFYDVAGEFPDVARFCAGDPLHMRRHKRERKPVIHLLVNVCCSGSIRAKTFAMYGGAVAALVDQIENSGHRVELDVVAINSHVGRGRSICGWKVKRSEDALDLSAVAYSIAHPGAYRRLIFAMWERLPLNYESGGYGTVEMLTRADADALGSSEAVLLDGVGMAADGVSAKEMNLRLARNVERALGIKILEDN